MKTLFVVSLLSVCFSSPTWAGRCEVKAESQPERDALCGEAQFTCSCEGKIVASEALCTLRLAPLAAFQAKCLEFNGGKRRPTEGAGYRSTTKGGEGGDAASGGGSSME